MRILVTGGAGFIGGATLRALAAKGHDAATFDQADGDVRDPEAVAAAVRGFDGVIHLAGVLGTHELFDDPQLAIDVNVSGTLNVLNACRDAEAHYVGITMPPVFPSVYTATKVAATRLASAYHHTYGLRVSHVRAFNAYGPAQKHGPGHPQKIVPTFATHAWRHRPIPVWGDGEQTVDLIHVDDLGRLLVDALYLGQDQVLDGGSGEAIIVREVAEECNELVGSSAGIDYLPMRRGEVATKLCATGEGWLHLDWRPRFDLERFAETVRSYKP